MVTGMGRAQALADIADGFALLNIEDAIALRKAGIQQPITLLEGAFDRAEVEAMAEYRIAGAIHSPHQIAWLREGSPPGPVEVWLKINSGMNRLGFRPEQAIHVMQQLRALPQVTLSTIMTHFATADDDRGVAAQWQRFAPVATTSGLAVSAANSGCRVPSSSHAWGYRPPRHNPVWLFALLPNVMRCAWPANHHDIECGHHCHPATASR
jgi:alanine racemase